MARTRTAEFPSTPGNGASHDPPGSEFVIEPKRKVSMTLGVAASVVAFLVGSALTLGGGWAVLGRDAKAQAVEVIELKKTTAGHTQALARNDVEHAEIKAQYAATKETLQKVEQALEKNNQVLQQALLLLNKKGG